MNIYQLLYLFLFSLFMTLTFTLLFKNRGPWNNPILFFLVLFMTTWNIYIWLGPVSLSGMPFPILTITAIIIVFALLIAGSKPVKRENSKMRKLGESEVLKVITKPEEDRVRILPNIYYWGILIIETLLIATAYLLRHNTILL